MPSALEASRKFLARAVGSIRSGISEADRRVDEPGPDFPVEPFDAHNSSTSAGLIKLGTSIQGGRRRAANYREALKGAALEREKTQAEIAHLRAQAAYELGQGRQSGSTPATLTNPVGKYPAGTLLTDVNAGMAQDRIDAAAKSQASLNASRGRVSAAQAALKDIDFRENRDIMLRAQKAMVTAEPVFNAIRKNGDNAHPDDLLAVGIDPVSWKLTYDEGGMTASQKAKLLDDAHKAIFDKYVSKHKVEGVISGRYRPSREKYQAIIDEGASGGFDSMNQGGAEGAGGENPNDPLGLGSFDAP